MAEWSLQLAYFYPTLMNLYGDRGNIMAFEQRCAARGINLNVLKVGIGDSWDPNTTDIVFIGGGQDREQRRIADDLQRHASGLREHRDRDGVLLAVCGGYQLFGHTYRDIDGDVLPGTAVFDAVSIHPGRQFTRCVGNVVASWEGETLVGFENHGGRTYLGSEADPLAKVVVGFGNNGGDGTEGARARNAFGTYLHGALLPKNPHLADLLIQLALQRRYTSDSKEVRDLKPINDMRELRAHAETLDVGLKSKRAFALKNPSQRK
jgi:CobQ-like glutamine amidotransferase family enzyme